MRVYVVTFTEAVHTDVTQKVNGIIQALEDSGERIIDIKMGQSELNKELYTTFMIMYEKANK